MKPTDPVSAITEDNHTAEDAYGTLVHNYHRFGIKTIPTKPDFLLLVANTPTTRLRPEQAVTLQNTTATPQLIGKGTSDPSVIQNTGMVDQRHPSWQSILHHAESPNPIPVIIVKHQGKLILLDGDHRVTAGVLRNRATPAKILELSTPRAAARLAAKGHWSELLRLANHHIRKAARPDLTNFSATTPLDEVIPLLDEVEDEQTLFELCAELRSWMVREFHQQVSDSDELRPYLRNMPIDPSGIVTAHNTCVDLMKKRGVLNPKLTLGEKAAALLKRGLSNPHHIFIHKDGADLQVIMPYPLDDEYATRLRGEFYYALNRATADPQGFNGSPPHVYHQERHGKHYFIITDTRATTPRYHPVFVNTIQRVLKQELPNDEVEVF